MTTYTVGQIKKELPELEFHPAANALPMMNNEKLQALKIDLLKTERLVNPIWLKDGMILDGRARYTVIRDLKAEKLLTFEPDIREWTNETDPNDMVMSLNIVRSNYNAQQRAMYAAKYILPELKLQAIERKLSGKKCALTGSSAKIAAKVAATNDRYVTWAGATLGRDESFYDLVMDGKVNLRESYAMVQSDTNPGFYKYMLAMMLSGKTYEQAHSQYQADQQRKLEEELRKVAQIKELHTVSAPPSQSTKPASNLYTLACAFQNPNPVEYIPDDASREEVEENQGELLQEVVSAGYRPAIMFAVKIRPTTMNKIVALLEQDLIVDEPISIWQGTSMPEETLRANKFRAIKNIDSRLPASKVIHLENSIAA